MPLGAKPNSTTIWNPVIERFNARLFFWNQISLSKGGKLAPLMHIHSSLPLYYFYLFKAPISIINILEKNMSDFLWEHNNSGSKYSHLINWKMVMATKERGGLGVLNLRLMNQAFIAKWS